MMKKIFIAALVLIVLLAAGAGFLWSNLDYIIKSAVEKYGSAATQASVSLDKVALSLADGQVSLWGLSVGNPKNFLTPKALYLGVLSVKLDKSSLTGNGPIVIEEIKIEKPQITYEINDDGQSNLQAIQQNAKTAASPGSPTASDAGTAENGSSGSRKFIVKSLLIQNGEIAVSHRTLKGQTLSVTLPTLSLTNIGEKSGGATPAELIEVLFGALRSSASSLASINLPQNLKDLAKSPAAKNVGSSLKGFFGK